MKNKIVFSIMLVLLFIFLGIITYFSYQNYALGSREEREELLIAVMVDLYEVESISHEEIEEIEISRVEAGVYPFYYYALVSLKNGEQLNYKWADKEKSGLKTERYGGD